MRVQYQSILCATDFSEFSDPILSYGLAMAKEFNARLYICHVVDIRSATMYGEAVLDLEAQEKRIREYVEKEMAARVKAAPAGWEPLIVFGRPATEIPRLVEEKQIELVITATHGRSGIRRLVLGSVTESLMRDLQCPLLVVNGHELTKMPENYLEVSFRRVLIGCDFSPDSQLAFEYGMSLAQEFESEVFLAHVMESSEYKEQIHHEQWEGEGESGPLKVQLEEKLAAMIPAEAAHWCTYRLALLEGKPYEALVRHAELNRMNLIVLGVRGHGLMETLFLGSTADRVVRRARCPVLLVRSSETGVASEPVVEKSVHFAPPCATISEESFFSVKRSGQIAMIALKDNLLLHSSNLQSRDAFFDHLDLISRNEALKAVIISGCHGKSGRREYIDFYRHILEAKLDANTIHRLLNSVDQVVLKILELNKVTIHADSGLVISMFLNISLACDFRIVADNTIFQNPNLELGMIPKGGSAYLLSKMLGSSAASKVLLTKDEITADEALSLGMVDQVVPLAAIERASIDFAGQFTQRSVRALAGLKTLLRYSLKDIRSYLESENREILKIIGSPMRDSEFWKNIARQD